MSSHDHGHGGSTFEAYWAIMTDPAHFWAEVTFTFIDILILSPLLFLVWAYVKNWVNKRVHREHHVLDQEHGVFHAPCDSECEGGAQ